MGETLLSCPFCGCPPEAETYPGGARVGCTALECDMAPEADGATMAIAVAAWNTRAAPREPGETERMFRWEGKLIELRRDAYDRVERMTCNADIKRGASEGTYALARLVLEEVRRSLLAARPDAGEG